MSVFQLVPVSWNQACLMGHYILNGKVPLLLHYLKCRWYSWKSSAMIPSDIRQHRCRNLAEINIWSLILGAVFNQTSIIRISVFEMGRKRTCGWEQLLGRLGYIYVWYGFLSGQGTVCMPSSKSQLKRPPGRVEQTVFWNRLSMMVAVILNMIIGPVQVTICIGMIPC